MFCYCESVSDETIQGCNEIALSLTLRAMTHFHENFTALLPGGELVETLHNMSYLAGLRRRRYASTSVTMLFSYFLGPFKSFVKRNIMRMRK